MAEHGGYRKPRKPAPVSGPGRLSRRTDGGPAQNVVDLPNARYGEGQEYSALQSAAPMAASPESAPAPQSAVAGGAGVDLSALLGAMGGGGAPVGPPTPLTSPTERPGEPLTAGAPVGPGVGPSAEVVAPTNRLSDLLERLLENDMTGEIADMYLNARRRGL